MRNEGGVAFQQMQKQSTGWHGLISTLVDNLKLSFATLGESMIQTLDLKTFVSDLIGTIQSLTAAFQKLPTPIQGFIVKGGLVLALLSPLLLIIGQIALGFGVMMIAISKVAAGYVLLSGVISKSLIPALVTAFGAVSRLTVAFFASPFGWVAAAIAGVAVAAFLIIKNWDKVKAFWSSLWDGITTKTQAAVAVIMPLIDALKAGFSFISDNPLVRSVSKVFNQVDIPSSSSQNNLALPQSRVDTGGELRIVIDENRPARVSASLNNSSTSASIDQGVLMGGAL